MKSSQVMQMSKESKLKACFSRIKEQLDQLENSKRDYIKQFVKRMKKELEETESLI